VSALRQEGVSYIARGLAMTMAHDLAVDVCLVELNWWGSDHSFLNDNPKIENVNRDGLTAVLAGEAELDDVLVETSYPNLWIAPSGEMPKQNRPVMARSRILKELIDELSSRFEHLILDIPAVLYTSDAVPLASLSTACCVVIRQGITPVNDVKQALDEIDHLPMLGVVLNNAKISTPSFIAKLIPQ
jgi:Mrp family chromosome partitioning ATPase